MSAGSAVEEEMTGYIPSSNCEGPPIFSVTLPSPVGIVSAPVSAMAGVPSVRFVTTIDEPAAGANDGREIVLLAFGTSNFVPEARDTVPLPVIALPAFICNVAPFITARTLLTLFERLPCAA